MNNIGTGEKYDLYHYNAGTYSPFSPYESLGTDWRLLKLQQADSPLYQQFVYNNSGEMTSTILPNGGEIAWDYREFTYQGGVKMREVYQRRLKKAPGGSFETKRCCAPVFRASCAAQNALFARSTGNSCVLLT